MQTVLIVFHLMVVIALVATVLLQRSEGGALGVGGGGFMTGRGQANALTRATAILGTLFFITSLGLTLLAHYNRGPRSIIDAAPTAPRTQTTEPAAPAGSTPLDRLRQMEQQQPNSGAPAGSATPAQPQAPATPAQPEVPKSQ